MANTWSELSHALARFDAPRVFVLTGAGVSRESGVPTFRDAGGLWHAHRWQELATPEGFARNPAAVHGFYNERRRLLATVAPNAAHTALAALESALGARFTLVTQNVDDLHERGGSSRAIHMHGELLKARCIGCAEVIPWTGDTDEQTRCTICNAGLRPHIVWFGELPLRMEESIARLVDADVFCAIGTSGLVYPASGFVELAREAGALTIEINPQPSGDRFDLVLAGPATEWTPAFAKLLLPGGAERAVR